MHFSSVGHTESCKNEKKSLVFSGKDLLSHFLFYLSLLLLIKNISGILVRGQEHCYLESLVTDSSPCLLFWSWGPCHPDVCTSRVAFPWMREIHCVGWRTPSHPICVQNAYASTYIKLIISALGFKIRKRTLMDF